MAPFSWLGRPRVAALSRKGLKSREKRMQKRVKRLKTEMEARSEEHKDIRQVQNQVKEKIQGIESECEELKRETRFIIQQSARTQVKIALMFRILKARENGDQDSATKLTQMLREIVGREEER
ncbi:uncharacterized protein LOC120123139 [Hibiscus syriacus]|uniref:uncharacterized protein LOC120123139 n=1 Tax=Hibiscus syriacus TaxID=106335 RepID=UPI001924CED0|nr:uncharacterized protein LOC120123139 [Hibiscus syriacus]